MKQMGQSKQGKEPRMRKGPSLAHGVGRRKSSVARVWLKRGAGAVFINGKPLDLYFDTIVTRAHALTPCKIVDISKQYDIHANVYGGGVSSQAGAVRLGISRALIQANGDLKSTLREFGLLTVDARVKERKKYGQRGARRKFQFVKR